MLKKRESTQDTKSDITSKVNSARAPRKPKFASINLSEQNGIRYLHFGTEWVQGAMRLRKPDWIELEYAQQMMCCLLWYKQPEHIVQLGLGTGALTKFCYRKLTQTHITAIELNPSVIAICNTMFKLPESDERLSIVEMDAMDYVSDAGNHGSCDVIQADLYDATAKGPVLDSAEFYQACADCLTPSGILTVNLFGDHPSFARNIKALRFVFDEVICLPEVHDGNVVALAFNTKPILNFDALYERAKEITDETKLPAKTWVNGIKAWQRKP